MAQAGGTVKFTAVKPQLVVKAPKTVDAIQFYKTAFGAVEAGSSCCPQPTTEQGLPNSNILCAMLELAGYSFVVYNDDSAPVASEGIACQLCLETEDVEAAISKAVSAGAVAEGEITEGGGSCCGGRVGKVKDPFGYVWLICSPSNNCTVKCC